MLDCAAIRYPTLCVIADQPFRIVLEHGPAESKPLSPQFHDFAGLGADLGSTDGEKMTGSGATAGFQPVGSV
jgi:hypothetical protein